MAQASIAKLSESLGIDDSIPRTLQDELGLRDASELASWPPYLLSTLYPELDRGFLYEMCKAAVPAETSELSPLQGEGGPAFADAADEFKNGLILQYLPRYDPAIDNQGEKNGCCTAFAASTMLDYYLAFNGRPGARVSRAFLYIMGNETEGKHIPWWSPFGLIPYNDMGVWPDTMSRLVPQLGSCLAQELPYDPSHIYYDAKANPVRLLQHPNPALRLQASHHQRAKVNVPRPSFKMSMLFPGNPFDWVTARIDNHLRAGLPSLYAFKTPASLGGASGVMPRLDGDNGTGHSVLIIGKKVNWSPGAGHPVGNWYIYRNSWGPDFGASHPLPEYRGQSCGVIHEHDVYWRTIQALFMSW